ncbi:hypothetical protein DM860_003055 [Cuscuta australis]|uniref:Phytocyanin domain-containing protein n=1 Tax=Cuscuta australis TaxID=267555 RepID=A0A328D185_9ASTE|nr:hypothetical protein DM860_003055 [Cuscuta australis]
MEMGCNKRNKNNNGGVAAVAVFLMVAAVTVAAVESEERHHYVVGGDRGWETSNFIDQINDNWSPSPRIFRVGDVLWFTYSAAQDNIVEVGSWEEYESCDLTNPIKMYTDGLNKISLDGEGIRYFASGNMDHCRNGLKLPVNVLPRDAQLAHGPSVGFANAPSPGLAQSPYSGGYGPVSSQSPSGNGWESGLSFNMMVGKQKWVKTESVDGAAGPTAGSAPISLVGLFNLLAVGLVFLPILSYYY